MTERAYKIMDVAQHPEIKELVEKYDEHSADLNRRMKFLADQAKKIDKEREKHHRAFWKVVEGYLKDHDLLPEWADPDPKLSFKDNNKELYLLECSDSDDDGIPTEVKLAILKHLTKS